MISEIRAKGKVEGWRDGEVVGESSKEAFALLVSQCAVITLKNSEKCIAMNNAMPGTKAR